MGIILRLLPFIFIICALILAFIFIFNSLRGSKVVDRVAGDSGVEPTADDLLKKADSVKTQVTERKSVLEAAAQSIKTDQEALEDRFPENRERDDETAAK